MGALAALKSLRNRPDASLTYERFAVIAGMCEPGANSVNYLQYVKRTLEAVKAADRHLNGELTLPYDRIVSAATGTPGSGIACGAHVEFRPA